MVTQRGRNPPLSHLQGDALADTGGSVLERYRCSAFGEVSLEDAAGNPLAASAWGVDRFFLGRPFDALTGLYDLRARGYDPSLGAFLSPDPLGFHDSWNLYQYGLAAPGAWADPSGRQVETDSYWETHWLSYPGHGGAWYARRGKGGDLSRFRAGLAVPFTWSDGEIVADPELQALVERDLAARDFFEAFLDNSWNQILGLRALGLRVLEELPRVAETLFPGPAAAYILVTGKDFQGNPRSRLVAVGVLLTTGALTCASKGWRAARGGPQPSARQIAKFERQLAVHDRRSLERSQRSIERRLREHVQKLENIRSSGGYTSSVEAEISNFQRELEAIRQVLGKK